MDMLLIAALMGCVSLLYATAGQAGGTGFLAIMAFAQLPAADMRATAPTLNIVAAGYATWRLHKAGAVDWPLLWRLTLPSLPAAFVGGLWALSEAVYFVLSGLVLIAAAAFMIGKRSADMHEARQPSLRQASAAGAGAGFLSGLTGVGGGVFLTPLLIAAGWASPRRAARLAPPFILCNSIVGLAGAMLAGQMFGSSTPIIRCGCAYGWRRWHGHRPSMDVRARDAICACRDPSHGRPSFAVSLSGHPPFAGDRREREGDRRHSASITVDPQRQAARPPAWASAPESRMPVRLSDMR
jgi:uncharacterized membrane protein YfcA